VLVAMLAIPRRAGDGRQGGGSARVALIGGAVAVLAVFVSGLSPYRLGDIADLGSGTGAYRAGIWNLALDELSTPGTALFGFGTNSFPQHHREEGGSGEDLYLSNLPLAVVYDGGLVGGGLFVVAIASLLRRAPVRARRSGQAAVLALLVASIATNPIWFAFAWWPFAVLSASAAADGDASGYVDAGTRRSNVA
jgi:hypothetical protein